VINDTVEKAAQDVLSILRTENMKTFRNLDIQENFFGK
jgi:hypothetical protein